MMPVFNALKFGFVRALIGFALFAGLAAAGASAASAEITGDALPGERITLYDSHVSVNPAGLVFLTERITVKTQGEAIKHGINRHFPLRWERASKKVSTLDVKVMSVKRNGQYEPFKQSKNKTELSLRIGSGDVFLEPGLHTYEIEYIIGDQVVRFDAWDEYYYNVVGTEWGFVVEEARFRLSLPVESLDAGRLHEEVQKVPERVRTAESIVPPSPFYSIDVYTGDKGAKGKDAVILPDGSVRTTAPLQPGQGLTVAYTWPRFILDEALALEGASLPDTNSSETYSAFSGFSFLDYIPDVSALLFFMLPLLVGWYYWKSWRKRRNTARMPQIIPLFSPPKGLTPGDLRYGLVEVYDLRAFGADILRLVSLGHLKVSSLDPDKPNGGTVLQKLDPPTRPSGKAEMEEHDEALLKGLFPDSATTSLTLTKERNPHIRAVYENTKAQTLKRHGGLFVKYVGPLFWGTFIYFSIPVAVHLLYEDTQSVVLVFGAFFMLTTFLLVALALMTKSLIGGIRRSKSLFGIVMRLGFTAAFWLGFIAINREIYGAFVDSWGLPDTIYLASLLCLPPPVLYALLVPKRTQKGMDFEAMAKGMVMYMETAEKYRYETLYPPEMDVEHFETLLPYAMGLGVGKTWADTFTAYLQHTGQLAHNFDEYSSWDRLDAFSSGVGSATASEPSSSGSSSDSDSGSGGSGSSGGGSGGGGGSGW
ncbi:DUF2207 domain-containing protein [Desulfovibrio sp. OttesenSCG-928-M14]|nr:DUF2207 domain-containing protein [Desulfovibrio sp. OttesenSCG-928-M14]